jgi:7-cyano-7-deazaguanine synthase in queuosine biosynthesis
VLHLSHLGEQANIHLGIEDYYNNLAGKLDDISKDLLRIASYVYVADTSVSRGGSADIWGKGWKRKFDFKIPLLQPYRWNDSTVKKHLQNVLSFLSEDHFEFTFSQWQDPIRQEFLNLFKTANEGIGADAVVLFSGGLDSLYATGILALTDKKKPILISHLSTNKIGSRQRMLVEAIQDTCASSTDWTFPHWAVRISRQGSEAKDRTQRTRSFLYATLGVTAAYALQVSDVFLCDNGVVSINLPPSAQTIGAMASRTTHPKFIRLYNELMRSVRLPEIKNTLSLSTKGDIVSGLRNIKMETLIPLTVSCARTHSMTKYQPHCGVCTQCLDRRLATVYAGLESEDPPEKYLKDIFKDSIPKSSDNDRIKYS